MFWIVAQHKEECKAPRKAGGCESEREDLLELLRVDELSSSGQRRQRRSGGRVLEVQLENLALEVKEIAFGFDGRLEDSRFG